MRLYAGVVSLALIGATLSPLQRAPADDGFPLSTYPMFAWKRATTQSLTYGLGMTAANERRYLTPAIAGSAEVLQARAIYDRAAGGGRATLAALCTTIAARVAVHPDFADVVTVRIVTGTHEALALLVRGVVGPERERARCPVRR